ncbi:MAG TPA: hypothetical protein VLB68_29095 [Pyrinomonadaceae bacterium]|nr:hypothetical protein [Pyrinomonadaceae bacterium]
MKFNRETLFQRVRAAFGSLRQSQVDGLNFLFDKLEGETNLSIEQSAYILATVKHETANTYQPIKEKRGRVGTKIRAIQDRYWGSGFYGRGYVQVTWEKNYRKFGIADDPDKALEPETAYKVLIDGMRKGLFTGYSLSHFINNTETDYINARKVVNGIDRATDIAFMAEKFEHALKASLITDPVTEQPAPQINVEHADKVEAPPVVPKPEKVEVQSLTQSLLSRVMAGGTAVVGAGTAVFGFLTQAFDKHPLPMTILVLGILAISAYMWNESRKRRNAREALIVQKAASQTENTVVLTK